MSRIHSMLSRVQYFFLYIIADYLSRVAKHPVFWSFDQVLDWTTTELG